MSVELFPAASYAVMVIIFLPISSSIPVTDQFAVPVAVPADPFAALTHKTVVTPTLSDALPARLTTEDLIL